MKIKTITPVHVGTGDENSSFQYRKANNHYLFYAFSDLMATVPMEKLLDDRFLNMLHQNDPDSKRKMDSQYRKYIQYTAAKSMYSLVCRYELNNENVSVQTKALTKPIIPGSTIKGAVMNAVMYQFLLDHFQDVKRIARGLRDNNIGKFDEYLFRIIGKIKESEIFLKLVSSCLLCSDVTFDEMGIFSAQRIGIKKTSKGIQGKDIVHTAAECILENQTKIGNYILFDYDSQKLKEYKKTEGLQFIEYFYKENLVRAIKTYTNDVIKEDINDKTKSLYAVNGVSYLADDLMDIKNVNLSNPNTCVLRLGKYTNTFSKSIAILFKQNDYGFYAEKFKNFNPVFRSSKQKARPESMPTTRFILTEEQNELLFGFVELEFDD